MATALSDIITGSKLNTFFTGLKTVFQNKITAGNNLEFTGDTLNASLPSFGVFNRSDLYDTTEKIVGKWIDGKPLYQKYTTFPSVSLARGGTWYDLVNVSDLNIETLVNCNLYAGSSVWNGYYLNITNGVFRVFSFIGNWICDAAILQYTKTTDSTNSYNFANENDYSTSEKVIGTWIDGKKLYQKTVSIGALPNNTSKTVAHNISNAKRFIYIAGYGYNPTSGNGVPIVYPGTPLVRSYVGPVNITITTNGDMSYMTESYITLKYTKTTD